MTETLNTFIFANTAIALGPSSLRAQLAIAKPRNSECLATDLVVDRPVNSILIDSKPLGRVHPLMARPWQSRLN